MKLERRWRPRERELLALAALAALASLPEPELGRTGPQFGETIRGRLTPNSRGRGRGVAATCHAIRGANRCQSGANQRGNI